MVLNRNGKNNPDGSFNWADAIIDAALVAMLALLPAIGAMAASESLGNLNAWVITLTTAGSEFVGFLALKRKLVKKE